MIFSSRKCAINKYHRAYFTGSVEKLVIRVVEIGPQTLQNIGGKRTVYEETQLICIIRKRATIPEEKKSIETYWVSGRTASIRCVSVPARSHRGGCYGPDRTPDTARRSVKSGCSGGCCSRPPARMRPAPRRRSSTPAVVEPRHRPPPARGEHSRRL